MLFFNKYAQFKYDFEKEFEGGLALDGLQVKEIRAGKLNLKESYIRLIKDELFLSNTGLSIDKVKILLNRYEIDRIKIYLDEKRHHVFPLGIFQKGRILKLKLATGIVKKQYQKTAQQKRKDDKISMAKAFKQKIFDI